jgi:hypothetical protein
VILRFICPACNLPVEAGDEVALESLRCPECLGPLKPDPPRPSALPLVSLNPELPLSLREQLRWLREASAYPELRSAIMVIHVFGTVLLGLWGLVEVFASYESGPPGWSRGAGLMILAFVWWKFCKPISSLFLDIADAVISLSRK